MKTAPSHRQRIFVGVFASPALQKEVAVWVKKFKNVQTKTTSLIRWLPPENLHLTLVPPWYVEKEEIKKLADQLSKGLMSKPFSLNFKTVSFGPKPRSPRLIWVAAEASEEFAQMQKEFLSLVGQKAEKRELKIHLTIGRFRPESFNSFHLKQLNEAVDWRETVQEVTLAHSKLLPTGARYSPIFRFPL